MMVFSFRVISDMDEPTNTLMGAHGYCTQVNLSFPFFSVTNSAGATQRFSTNHKTSSEQKNQSLFLSDQSQMRVKSDWELKELRFLFFCTRLVIGGKTLGGPG